MVENLDFVLYKIWYHTSLWPRIKRGYFMWSSVTYIMVSYRLQMRMGKFGSVHIPAMLFQQPFQTSYL